MSPSAAGTTEHNDVVERRMLDSERKLSREEIEAIVAQGFERLESEEKAAGWGELAEKKQGEASMPASCSAVHG